MGLFPNDAYVISALLIIAMVFFYIRRQKNRIHVKDNDK